MKSIHITVDDLLYSTVCKAARYTTRTPANLARTALHQFMRHYKAPEGLFTDKEKCHIRAIQQL